MLVPTSRPSGRPSEVVGQQRPLLGFGGAPEPRGSRLHGWHRAFCIYSEHYRGTPKQPD